jgi:single-stranded DNA-binding protein
VAGNRIEIWGRLMGEPELRITPAGSAILRFPMEFGEQSNHPLAVIMSGDAARASHPSLKTGVGVRVNGSLKTVRRRLKSGLFETGYEVIAESIKLEESQN